MFREIRTSETIREEDERRRRENLGYLNIKPETDITIEEARDFWDGVFDSFRNQQIIGNI